MTDVLQRISERLDGTTHWDGCEDEHLLCAAYKEIERLRTDREVFRKTIVGLISHRRDLLTTLERVVYSLKAYEGINGEHSEIVNDAEALLAQNDVDSAPK